MSEGLGAAWEAAMELARTLSAGVLKGALDDDAAQAALERIGEAAGALLAVMPPATEPRVGRALKVVARAAGGVALEPLPEAAVKLALGASRSGCAEANGLIEHIRETVELALDGCADRLDAAARTRLEAIRAAAEAGSGCGGGGQGKGARAATAAA